MDLLCLNNVTRSYEINDGKKYALNHFSYTFPSCGFYGVVGKSGSGKSTLLNLISLLDKPTDGDIYFMNENIQKWSDKRKRQYRFNDLGLVFQHYNLIESETVLYNIALPQLIAGKTEKAAFQRAQELLDSIGFRKTLYNQKVKDFSGGEKERVAILRSIANNPRMILADEPTGALDSRNSELFMKMFKDISKSKLVIMVSHNNKLIDKYADEIITIKDGLIVKQKAKVLR